MSRYWEPGPLPRKSLVAAICVATILAAHSNYSARSTCQQPDPYGAMRARSRFAELAASLPPGGSLGYLSDLPTSEHTGGVWRQAAQYALAPRLVVDSVDVEWVIGNFSRPADVAQVGAAHGLRMVRDFGNGAVLYRRELR